MSEGSWKNPPSEKLSHGVDRRANASPTTSACPVCGGRPVEIRGKLQCSRCRTICETCCEGGRG